MYIGAPCSRFKAVHVYWYSQVHNKRGGFKDFEKLLNGGRVKISGGGVVETKYKRKETRIGLSLLTSLSIGISNILRSRSKYQESIHL